ncbi:lysozyme inhibitor LprI family protein [Stutzerimonas frequens]|uniref:lysozyme inhibitor LprI family protein n=1 Tax=Stutzerimonas frequens TaxID=2968969 RepID=UPI00398AFDB0
MHRFLAICLLALATKAYSEPENNIDCANAFSTSDIENCASISLEKTEKELNLAYQKLVKDLSQPNNEYENFTECRKNF